MLCELCECEEAYNFHHFIPRTVHRNKWFKKRFSREEMRAGLNICKVCHHMIHNLVPEKELGRRYHTKEKLLEHPEVAKYIQWKRKKHGNQEDSNRRQTTDPSSGNEANRAWQQLPASSASCSAPRSRRQTGRRGNRPGDSDS